MHQLHLRLEAIAIPNDKGPPPEQAAQTNPTDTIYERQVHEQSTTQGLTAPPKLSPNGAGYRPPLRSLPTRLIPHPITSM